MTSKRIHVGLLGLAGALALAGCGKGGSGGTEGAASAAAGASAARATQAVSVFTAQKRDVPVTVEAAGTVVALDMVDVRAQLSGTISEVLVKDGQFVKRGQPLFRVDDRAERANLDKARAQLLRDQASLGDLERQWKRAQELRAQNFIAQSAADTAQANYESQRAAVAASLAAVRAAEVGVGFGTIVAPLTGRAGAVTAYRGTLVQPNGNVLVNINQVDPIGVNFSVPETQLASLLRGAGGSAVDSGAEVSVIVPTGGERGARGGAAPADALRGKVVFVDNAVDTPTGTIRVKAALPNAAQALWPGQYVTVRMTTRTMADALVIPQAALIIRGNERSVYVVKPDATVEQRPVQTRLPVGELVVVEGVQPGEKIVVDGKQNLRPGSPVKDTPYTPSRRGAGGAAVAASSTASTPAPGPVSAASGNARSVAP